MENRRVLVIGLDGATWDLLKQWIKEDELPLIEKLIKNGVYGTLKSAIPCQTELKKEIRRRIRRICRKVW